MARSTLIAALVCSACSAPTPVHGAEPLPHASATATPSAAPEATKPDDASSPSRFAQGGTILQKTLLGGSGSVRGGALALDGSGNRVLAGGFAGVAKFGDLPAVASQGNDIYLVVLDPKNKPVSAKRFGGSGDDTVEAAAFDTQGNLYLGGAFESPAFDLGSGPLKSAGLHDLFLAKLDPSGKLLWAHRYGDVQEQMDMHLCVVPSGGVVVTGWFNGTLDFGGLPVRSPLNQAFYAARVDADGKARWGRAFGHRLDYAETGVVVDAEENALVSAGSDGVADFVPGGHASAGNDLGPVLLKLDTQGKTLFGRRFGAGADNLSTGLALDSSGGLRFVSASVGTTDFLGEGRPPSRPGQHALVVTAFDTHQGVIWSREILAAILSVAGVVVDAKGNTIVVGQFSKDSPQGSREDGYVIKLDDKGNTIWALDVNDGVRAWMTGVALESNGNIVVVGTVTPDTPGAQDQLWIATIAP